MKALALEEPVPVDWGHEAKKIPEHEVHKLEALALEEPVPVDWGHEATRYLSMRFIS